MKDPIQQWLLKLMKVLCVTAVTLSLISEVLRNVTTTQLVVTGAVVSFIAYFIRKARRGPDRRSRSASAGERTPVMPRTDS
jgi:hypothetical protein